VLRGPPRSGTGEVHAKEKAGGEKGHIQKSKWERGAEKQSTIEKVIREGNHRRRRVRRGPGIPGGGLAG